MQPTLRECEAYAPRQSFGEPAEESIGAACKTHRHHPSPQWLPHLDSINVPRRLPQDARHSTQDGQVDNARGAYHYEEANGCRVPEGLHVLHGRGCDRRCVRPDHLRLGNRLENMVDAKAEKRGCGVRKLSLATAQAII